MISEWMDMPQTLGVIPVLVNTGAALIPAAIAAVVSVLSLLFKPRELWKAVQKRPLVPLLVLGVLGIGYWGFRALQSPGSERGPSVRGGADKPVAPTGNWDQVALEILRGGGRAASRLPVQTLSPGAADASTAWIYRGGAERSGDFGGPALRNLEYLWSHHPDPFAMVLASPLPHGNRVFGASATLDGQNSYGAVFALDMSSGNVLWKQELLREIPETYLKGFFSSPALTADGKRLIIGQGLHADADCELICLDADTGEVLWVVPTPLHVESSPAIEGDIVVVGAGAIEKQPEGLPKGDPEGIGHPGFVFAVRISTGELLWRHTVIDPESSPVIHNGIAYIGSGMNGAAVVALRAAEADAELQAKGLSREVWRVKTDYPAVGAVTLADGLLFMGCGNSDFVNTASNPAGVVLALDPETGATRWKVETEDSVLGSIAVRDGLVFVPVRSAARADGRPGRAGQMLALDAATGTLRWRHTLDRNTLLLAGPAVTATQVYLLASDGYLRVLDRATGEKLEEHYVNDPSRPGELGLSIGDPVVAQGLLFLGSETGGLRAYRGEPVP